MPQQGVIYLRKKKTLKLYVQENYLLSLMAFKYIYSSDFSACILKKTKQKNPQNKKTTRKPFLKNPLELKLSITLPRSPY